MAKGKAPSKKVASKPAKKAVTKSVTKSVPKKAPTTTITTTAAPKFASKSCRKCSKTGGFNFKGALADGFVVATTGSTKEGATFAAQVILDVLVAYQGHQRAVENTRRRKYRKDAAAKKAGK